MDNQQLALAIGKLQGLAEASQQLHKTSAEEIDKLTTAILSLTTTVQAVAAAQATQTARIDRLEPDVADWRRTKMQGLGAIGAAGLAGALVLSFAKDIGAWIAKVLS